MRNNARVPMVRYPAYADARVLAAELAAPCEVACQMGRRIYTEALGEIGGCARNVEEEGEGHDAAAPLLTLGSTNNAICSAW